MVSPDREPAAIGAAVVVELGGAVLRVAGDAPPALVSAVVRSLLIGYGVRHGQRTEQHRAHHRYSEAAGRSGARPTARIPAVRGLLVWVDQLARQRSLAAA